MKGARGVSHRADGAAVEHLRQHVSHHDHGEPGCDGGFEYLRPGPGLAVGEDQEVEDTDQENGGVLDQGEGAGAVIGLESDFVFEGFLEEFDGREIAGAEAQAFEIEQLDESDQAQQERQEGDEDDQDCESCSHPFDQALQAGRGGVRQRHSARAIRPRRFHDPCPAGGAGRAASGCGFRFQWSGRRRRLVRRARPAEMAISPRVAYLADRDRPGGLSYRERQDIGRVVFAQEVAVEAAEFAVAGNQAGEAGASGDFAAQSPGEAFQIAAVQFRRGAAEQNYMVV